MRGDSDIGKCRPEAAGFGDQGAFFLVDATLSQNAPFIWMTCQLFMIGERCGFSQATEGKYCSGTLFSRRRCLLLAQKPFVSLRIAVADIQWLCEQGEENVQMPGMRIH